MQTVSDGQTISTPNLGKEWGDLHKKFQARKKVTTPLFTIDEKDLDSDSDFDHSPTTNLPRTTHEVPASQVFTASYHATIHPRNLVGIADRIEDATKYLHHTMDYLELHPEYTHLTYLINLNYSKNLNPQKEISTIDPHGYNDTEHTTTISSAVTVNEFEPVTVSKILDLHEETVISQAKTCQKLLSTPDVITYSIKIDGTLPQKKIHRPLTRSKPVETLSENVTVWQRTQSLESTASLDDEFELPPVPKDLNVEPVTTIEEEKHNPELSEKVGEISIDPTLDIDEQERIYPYD